MTPIRFIHMSDTHIGPAPDFSLHTIQTLPKTKKLIDHIHSLSFTPDFVIHTGDIAANYEKEAYQLVSEAFSELKLPIYYVTGNHDRSRLIHEALHMGPKIDLTTNKELLTYSFEVQDVHCVVVDGRGPDEIDPEGLVSPEQMDLLKKELSKARNPVLIFIHFSAFSLDFSWDNMSMLLKNGEEFHRLLVDSGKVKGVFFGHVHRSVQVVRDGIFYSSAASAFCNFGIYPDEKAPTFSPIGTPSYNLVSLVHDRLVVKQYSIQDKD